VTSDFIVGFCGETDAEFRATLDLVRESGFKNSFIFKYSPRPGTKAFQRQPDDVPEEVKKERHRLLLDAQTEASRAGNQPFVGTRQEVLVEGLSARDEKRGAAGTAPAADGIAQLTGRTRCDRIVVFDAPLRLVGRLVDVDVVAAGPWSLAGLVAEPAATVPRDDSGRDAASCDTGPVLHAIRPAPSAPTRREA